MSGIGGTPPSAALDQFLRDSYDVVQAVHRDLASIRAVASHLTPVEDLVEFQNEVTALHAKLGVLVYASGLLEAASDAGIDVLTAADAPAQRALLEIKSAALQETSYFATAAGFNALALQVAVLSDSLNGALVTLATKVDQAELTAALAPILARLDDVEDGLVQEVGEANDRITLLISQLQDGSFGSATSAALDALTTRVNLSETGIDLLTQRTVALESSVAGLDLGMDGQALAVQQLTTQVNNVGNQLNVASDAITALTTRADNLETGQSAASTAMGLLQSRTTVAETSIASQGLAINQLTAGITDALNQASLNTSAISGLETRMLSSESGQLALSSDISQLAARVTDTETGLDAAADATSALVTRVEATELGLTVSSEERTALRASLTSTGNHLPNSSFAVNLRGWTLFSRGDGWLDAQLERNLAPTAPGALPEGMFALSLTQDEVPAGNAGIRCSNVPVEDLASYMLSGYLAAENCTIRLEWRLLNGAGAEIGFGLAGQSTQAPSARLSAWDRVFAEIPVALDGAYLQIQVWITNCNTGFPKAWLIRPQLEPVIGEQEGPSPWMDGVAGIEETFSTAVQTLETRVTQTEDELDTVAQAVTELGSSLGTVREWRLTHHSGSAAFDTVGSPLAPGLRAAGSETMVHALQRGLTLLRFGLDGELASATRFDTFGSVTERNNLRDALLALTADDSFILVSQDQHGIKQADLTAALESCGALAFAGVTGSKPYVLIGRGLAGKGAGVEYIPIGGVQWQDTYITVVNDTPKGMNQAIGDVVAGQATAISSLTTRVTDNEAGLVAVASDVTALDARLDTAENSIGAQGSALTDLTVRVTATEDEVTTLAQDVTQLETNLDAAEADIVAQGLAAAALTSRVTATEDEIVGINSDLVSLDGRLDSAELGLTAQAGALSTLGTRVTATENSITSQASSLTALASSLANIGGANLLPNAGMEDAATSTRPRHWMNNASGGVTQSPSRVSSTLAQSQWAFRNEALAVPAGSFIGFMNYASDGEAYPKVEPEKPYILSAIVKATAGMEIQSILQFRSSTNVLLQTDNLTPVIATGGYQRFVLPVTSPVNAAYVTMHVARVINNSGAAANLFIEVDNVQLQEGTVATPWEPSTMYGDKVNATAITALDTRVTDNEGEISAISTAQTALTSRVGDMEGALVNEIITSANNDAAHTASINTLSARMLDAEGDILASAGAISALDTRVTNTEGVVSSQSSALTSLQAQVDAIDEGTGGAGAAISALDTRVTSAEGTLVSQGNAITSLQNSVTSANKVFVQDEPPSTAGRTNGDIWIDTNDGNKIYTFNSATTSWVLRQDGNKNRIFVQASAPTGANVNDLWFDSDDGFKCYRWTGSAWQEITDVRTAANASAITDLSTRVSSVEGVNTSQANALTALESRLDSPTTGLSALATATNALSTRVTDAEGDITAQASSLSSLTTTVNGNTTTISQHSASINGLSAQWSLTLDANGYVSGLFSTNNGTKADFTVLADDFYIVAPGAAKQRLFGVNTTGAYLSGDLFMGGGKIISDTGSHMKVVGVGFGTSDQFVEWFGPKMAINLCNEGNAIYYMKTNGDAYFGGSLSAGILKNSVQSTQLSYTASVSTGEFGSNGGPRIVTCTFNHEHIGWAAGNLVGVGSPISTTMTLYRNGTQLTSQVVTGYYEGVQYDDEFDRTRMRSVFSGSISLTDNTVLATMEYTLTLSNPTGAWPMSLNPTILARTQRLSLISVEE